MMDILDDRELLPEAARYLALKCVMKHPPRRTLEALQEITKICFPGKKKGGSGKRVTSYDQDAGLIRAAFLQTYGIDLWVEDMHWLKFRDLMDGLPTEGSRYAEITGIRARPMPKATKYNADERKWLAEAKKAYALDMTEDEREASYQQGVLSLFNSLSAMIPKESDGDGGRAGRI